MYFILTNLNETNKQTTLSWLMATTLDSGDLEDKLTPPHWNISLMRPGMFFLHFVYSFIPGESVCSGAL